MTPIRKKEALKADLIGLENLLTITPEDPMATPLLKSRIEELKKEIETLEDKPPITPETEIFFGQGAVIGSDGIEATFAGKILEKFQDMVTNHFAANFCGGLHKMGRRRGEEQSKLFLTALPKGSFGLQLSQPYVTDFVLAGQLTQTMEEITDLVISASTDDQSFVDTISHFHGRVLVPLEGFLAVMNNSGSDCKIISGTRKTALKKEEVSAAYQRVLSAQKDEKTTNFPGLFGGLLLGSGRFEFTPVGEKRIEGWVAEEVTDAQAIEMEKFAGKQCEALMRLTTISFRTGKQSFSHELIDLKPIQALPAP